MWTTLSFFRIAVIAASLSFVGACADATTTPSNPNPSSGDSGTNNDPAKPRGGGEPAISALDGTWDITSVGNLEIAPSTVTVNDGTAKGTLVFKDEGESFYSPYSSLVCTRVKHRVEFEVSIDSRSLNGTVTELSVSEGGGSCDAQRRRTSTITGTHASGGTDISGDWDAQISGEEPFVFSVDGLTGKGWTRKAKASGGDPTMTFSASGTVATFSSTSAQISFAARRQ